MRKYLNSFLDYSLNLILYVLVGAFFILSVNKIKYRVNYHLNHVPAKYKISTHIGVEFKPYLVDFLDDAYKGELPKDFAARLDSLTIKYGNTKGLGDNFVGFCDMNTTTVIVDYKAWNTFSTDGRQQLIDHELGHCLLERNHRNLYSESEHPGYINPHSIMYPSVLSGDYYRENKVALREELFEKKRFDLLKYSIEIANKNYKEWYPKFNNQDLYLAYVNNWVNDDLPKPAEPEVVQMEPIEVTSGPDLGEKTQ